MWRNEETKEFVQWMKERNDNVPLGDKTEFGLGIYGMDVRTDCPRPLKPESGCVL